MTDSINPPPWYKQFWVWFIIALPVLSMILSLTMMSFAINTSDSLVIDDYYKEGKGINRQLSKIQEAKAKNIKTRLSITPNNVSITFVSGTPESGEAIELEFFHATLVDRDFRVLLTKDAAGVYRSQINNNIKGKWKLSLHPYNQQWKIVQDFTFPANQSVDFNP